MILGFIIGGLIGCVQGLADSNVSYKTVGNSMYKSSLNGAIIGGVALGIIGGVVNRGDSFRRRRSRSNSLAPPGFSPQQQQQQEISNTTNLPVVPPPPPEITTYRVALVGAQGVGKTALISQFMTSECINAYDRSPL
ncbi:hypothetical protein Phum_PHUM565970 [Pediculus humanus corporis]|uniref:Uncharacterized protein n=1 Tax=Pediculus humanus subsp. corporis TaxID=121224 RepID=E0W0Z7_PEDHC|nr:uncharacterized protein Phum_PHUM565970 [Pediculus humanus corporis]EEB19302.1 hypothetical protein Phum_PHUM565970 [Pediculus humanus corporis]